MKQVQLYEIQQFLGIQKIYNLNEMINQARRDEKKHYKVYFFQFQNYRIHSITECKQNDQMYHKGKNGFYRRVNVSSILNNSQRSRVQFFEDNFQIDFSNNEQNPQNRFKPRRLFNVYQKQQKIFKNYSENQQSFIDYQKSYSSFASEIGLLDKILIQSIFLTRQINQKGYYQYFIRRNGEYYLECIDDTIPVDGRHQEPIWGLSYNCPWELLLLKAWIKEKGGITGVLHAQPYQFLYAFGLPGYSVKNIRKELEFLKRENSELQLKKKKQEKLPLNRPEFNIYGKTRSNNKIEELGLIKNCLGYKITPIRPSKSLVSGRSNEKTIYKVHSTVPSKWIGSMSIVNKNENFQDYNFKNHPFNLQKEFLATEQEILSIFSRFYMAPDYFKIYSRNHIYQDSYLIDNALQDTPYVFKLKVLEDGFFNLNIEHMESSKRAEFIKGVDRVRWPYIKYFMAKVQPQIQEHKPNIVTQRGIPNQFQPNLEKYKYYDIEFMKGYHRSINRFIKIVKGEYLIYVKIQNLVKGVPQIDYTLSVSSSAKFQEIFIADLDPYQMRQLVDSTIFDYSKIHGERYIRDHIQYIYLGNSFREIGFGFMSLQIREPSSNEISKLSNDKKKLPNPREQQLGIRILPGKFNKLKLAGYYYQAKDGGRSKMEQSYEPITMISELGNPKIIVLQNPHYDFELTQEFPEPGSIEVYTMKKNKFS